MDLSDIEPYRSRIGEMDAALSLSTDALPGPVSVRTAALDMACRVVPVGDSTSHVLSTARYFETYIATGLVRTGPKWQSAVEIGREGVSVTVEAPGLAPEVTERLRVAVAGVLGASACPPDSRCAGHPEPVYTVHGDGTISTGSSR